MNDLTWAELLAALPPDAVFVDSGRGVCVNVSLVSGESPNLNLLTQVGVIEFCYKLLDAANRAQTTKNAALPAGSKLNSFGAPIWSTPTATGSVTARHSVAAQFTVSTAVAVAPLT
ncbi:hypothetical protein QUB37_03895 [Microcoleus sp. AT3-A2]|uniref:hypothetical protein n=1 Tax=Microcoleus sp. AT3-A2 TaxID=2818610 RepID=UPI002FCE6C87